MLTFLVALVLLAGGNDIGAHDPSLTAAQAQFDRCLTAMSEQASMDVLHAVCEAD
jgi:hypothetical protein